MTIIQDIINYVEQNLENVTANHRLVTKNNGVKLNAIEVHKADFNIGPIIYIDHLLTHNHSPEEIGDYVIDQYLTHDISKNFDVESINKYENVKENLTLRLINYQSNIDILQEIPHKKYIDLAIIVVIQIELDGLNASIKVTEPLLKRWSKTFPEVYIQGLANFYSEPRYVRKMDEIISEMMDNDVLEGVPNMLVITNRAKQFGANAMLDITFMDSIASEIDDDLVIIPSSLHEIIILPRCGNDNYEVVNSMINEVNSTQLIAEDILSDHCYIYSRMTREIRSC